MIRRIDHLSCIEQNNTLSYLRNNQGNYYILHIQYDTFLKYEVLFYSLRK